MTTNDELMHDIGMLKRDIGDMRTELASLRRALIGSYDTPGGMAVIVEKNRGDLAELRANFAEHRAERDRLVKEYEARLVAVESWIEAMRNRVIGLGIGLALGSASIGAVVGGVVQALLGG